MNIKFALKLKAIWPIIEIAKVGNVYFIKRRRNNIE